MEHPAGYTCREVQCLDQRTIPPRGIFCILHPEILHRIIGNGTPLQAAAAVETLDVDQSLRFARALRSAYAQAARQLSSVTLAIKGLKQRMIFDVQQTYTSPGAVVRAEGGPPTGDPAVDEAYDGLGMAYDFFWEAYGINPIHDRDALLAAAVHVGQHYDNALFDGERLVFGDGDGELFNRFTIALDVIGHEFAHGVIAREARLVYFAQSGALIESIADVFGSLVKQRVLSQTADQADWLVGVGVFTADVNGVALRSMKAPGTAYDDPVLGRDPQAAHMGDYVQTVRDYGGVHFNSSIPNHAFYRTAVQIGGYAWEKAGRIWYETLRDPRLPADATFQQFAQLTWLNAGLLFGHGSPEQQAVRAGWGEVGMEIG
jgi:Zn-dependent metalloprotease